jgi:hypothetical protein
MSQREPLTRQAVVLSMGEVMGLAFVQGRYPQRGESSFAFVIEPSRGLRPTTVRVHDAPRMTVDGEVELGGCVATWQIVGGYAEKIA